MRRGKGAFVALVGFALVGGMSLTGCGVDRAGVAASIDDLKLSISTVDARVDEFFDAYPAVADGPTKAQIATATVQNYLRATIVDITAANNGITCTETEIDDFITQFGGTDKLNQAVATQGVPPDTALTRIEVRSAILQTKMQDLAGADADDFARAAAFTDRRDATIATLDIEVNPRYGKWGGSVVDALNGSLSITEAETTPTPTVPIAPAG